MSLLFSLPLLRLSFDITWFHKELNKLPIPKPLSFTSVTHLHLIGMDVTLRAEEIELYFPNLTHMALNGDMDIDECVSHQSILDCWGDQLQVLIWHTISQDSVSDDPRVVLMAPIWNYVHDWNEATKDGPSSVWTRAEVEVERRRRSVKVAST
ncbi:hypothetical protein BDN72DRAFT_612614 [Pluteus cervinus]|uniref:Uncharacterized protein n=1 Tax=Pluteus cervinus TaxID=181527 RepID=A0ACD3AU42_9AGAR|nr:hypothetical protein BDN72DRAFT_612614 [Pluteus cervinus]